MLLKLPKFIRKKNIGKDLSFGFVELNVETKHAKHVNGNSRIEF